MPSTTELAGRLAEVVSLQQDVLRIASGGDGAVMDLVVERIIEIANATGGVIELAHGDDLVYRAASGPVKRYVGIHLPMESSLSGLAVRTREVINCPDVELDPRVDIEACRDMGIRSMIVAPLLDERGAVGVLKAYSDRKEHFDDLDVYAVQLVAGFTASSVRLEKQIRAFVASEERYRLLFENNVAGVFRTTVDGRILDCNKALVDVLGYDSREDLMQRRSPELYARSDHRDALMKKLIEERTMLNVRIPLKRKDGSTVDTMLNIGTLEPVNGEKQLIGTVVKQ